MPRKLFVVASLPFSPLVVSQRRLWPPSAMYSMCTWGQHKLFIINVVTCWIVSLVRRILHQINLNYGIQVLVSVLVLDYIDTGQ